MRISDFILLSLLDEGNAPPNNSNHGNPVNGMWKLIKFILFLFLLLWFLFHQNFFYVEIKPGRKESRVPAELRDWQDGNYEYHRVSPGETLSQIAHQRGVSQSRLISINEIDDPDLIKSGQVLLIREINPPATQQAKLAFIN